MARGNKQNGSHLLLYITKRLFNFLHHVLHTCTNAFITQFLVVLYKTDCKQRPFVLLLLPSDM